MWLYLVVLIMVVAGVAGGIFGGGIFTIVLLPIAAIVLIVTIMYRSMGAIKLPGEGGEPGSEELPHASAGVPGHVRTSPEGLADARRAQQ